MSVPTWAFNTRRLGKQVPKGQCRLSNDDRPFRSMPANDFRKLGRALYAALHMPHLLRAAPGHKRACMRHWYHVCCGPGCRHCATRASDGQVAKSCGENPALGEAGSSAGRCQHTPQTPDRSRISPSTGGAAAAGPAESLHRPCARRRCAGSATAADPPMR